MTDHAAHPRKTAGKILDLYIKLALSSLGSVGKYRVTGLVSDRQKGNEKS
jgi:hypothetical protein